MVTPGFRKATRAVRRQSIQAQAIISFPQYSTRSFEYLFNTLMWHDESAANFNPSVGGVLLLGDGPAVSGDLTKASSPDNVSITLTFRGLC